MTVPLEMMGAQETLVVAPLPSQNQVDSVGQRSADELASTIIKSHQSGIDARRTHDLISEKLLLHIDGSGDFQWADIFADARVEIPRAISEFRKTENLLRPIVDNAVAHHTRNPLRYYVEAQPDRESQDRALVDSLLANYVSQSQGFNSLFADALYLAMPAGFCPVHCYWREDGLDTYEGVQGGQSDLVLPTKPGIIDCWVGNPFDTVVDPAARRGSVRWRSYGRWLPADAVRQAFAHVPGIDTLEGGTRMPSAALFHKIARDWRLAGLGLHGSPTIEQRRSTDKSEEMLYVLCREVMPGVAADYPEGRLQIVAIPGEPDFRRGGGQKGRGFLLADQVLPGSNFSSTDFYSHFRGDDVLGKPWAEDLDQIQVDLNIALSKRWEVLNRMIEAPIVAPGGAISEDMADLGGYNLLEVDPSLAGWRPRVMEWPKEILGALNKECDERRKALYTIGGYQAASRGEAPGSRMAYRAILALQQADSTVHGPVNVMFQRSATEFAQRCWTQMKTYGDVPWLVTMTGDEYEYLADPYIDKTKLSEGPPSYKLVNAFGATPEMRAQEVLELVQMRGADGQPLLSTEEARRQYPVQTLFGEHTGYKAVARRRARKVVSVAHSMTRNLRAETGIQGAEMNDPEVNQAALQIFADLETKFPRLRDDDLRAHIEVYSELTQDETADPITRIALIKRQDMYYEWQAMQAGQMPTQAQPSQATAAQAQQRGPSPQLGQEQRQVAQAMGGGGGMRPQLVQ